MPTSSDELVGVDVICRREKGCVSYKDSRGQTLQMVGLQIEACDKETASSIKTAIDVLIRNASRTGREKK
jgi:hypothetical protein